MAEWQQETKEGDAEYGENNHIVRNVQTERTVDIDCLNDTEPFLVKFESRKKEDDVTNLRDDQDDEGNPEEGHSVGEIIRNQHHNISDDVSNRDEDRQNVVEIATAFGQHSIAFGVIGRCCHQRAGPW